MSSSPKLCGYCGERPRVPAFAPFCSQGCRDRDLNAWLGDRYALPAGSDDDELTGENPGTGLDRNL